MDSPEKPRGAARAEPADASERLRLVVENAREYAIVSMDLDRRVASWNVGARELTGYAEDDVLGLPADLIFVAEDRVDGAPQREARLALADDRAADERWHRRKDGSRFWGSGVMMAMRSHGTGEPIGLLKIFRDQTYVRLVVADNGMGISAGALALIFDAFAQEGQWVTSEFGGLGPGLAIAKVTVDAHHGTLGAASGGRNQGATFTITPPIGRAHSS